MSTRNYVKKLGKRIAGTWGRINHKRDMRAASKGARKQAKSAITKQWAKAHNVKYVDIPMADPPKPEDLNGIPK